MRNGVGNTGSAPPVKATVAASPSDQPAIGRIVRRAWVGSLADSLISGSNWRAAVPTFCAIGSLQFDAGELYHLAPLLGFLGDQRAELGRRHRHGNAAQVVEPRFHLGVGKAGVDLFVELVDDVGGRALGRADA